MVPLMGHPSETPRRSAFAAAVFSLLIPGFGHLYDRRWRAALLFLAPPALLLSLVGGIIAADGLPGLVGLLITPFGLSAAGILNILLAFWRGAASADAWRGAVRRESGVRTTAASFAGLVIALVAAISLLPAVTSPQPQSSSAGFSLQALKRLVQPLRHAGTGKSA